MDSSGHFMNNEYVVSLNYIIVRAGNNNTNFNAVTRNHENVPTNDERQSDVLIVTDVYIKTIFLLFFLSSLSSVPFFIHLRATLFK